MPLWDGVLDSFSHTYLQVHLWHKLDQFSQKAGRGE